MGSVSTLVNLHEKFIEEAQTLSGKASQIKSSQTKSSQGVTYHTKLSSLIEKTSIKALKISQNFLEELTLVLLKKHFPPLKKAVSAPPPQSEETKSEQNFKEVSPVEENEETRQEETRQQETREIKSIADSSLSSSPLVSKLENYIQLIKLFEKKSGEFKLIKADSSDSSEIQVTKKKNSFLGRAGSSKETQAAFKEIIHEARSQLKDHPLLAHQLVNELSKTAWGKNIMHYNRELKTEFQELEQASTYVYLEKQLKELSLDKLEKNFSTIEDFYSKRNVDSHKNNKLIFNESGFQIVPKSDQTSVVSDPAKVMDLVLTYLGRSVESLVENNRSPSLSIGEKKVTIGILIGRLADKDIVKNDSKLTSKALDTSLKVMLGEGISGAKINYSLWNQNRLVIQTYYNLSGLSEETKIDIIDGGKPLLLKNVLGLKGEVEDSITAQIQQAVSSASNYLNDPLNSFEKVVNENIEARKTKILEAKKLIVDTPQTDFATPQAYEEWKTDLEKKIQGLENKNQELNQAVFKKDVKGQQGLYGQPLTLITEMELKAIGQVRKMFDDHCNQSYIKTYHQTNKAGAVLPEHREWNKEAIQILEKQGAPTFFARRNEINELFEASQTKTDKLADLMEALKKFAEDFPQRSDLKEARKELGEPLPVFIKRHADGHLLTDDGKDHKDWPQWTAKVKARNGTL